LIVLGIDPGSITTGWALLKSEGNKIKYISSGVLSFDKKTDFLERLTEIKIKSADLLAGISPDEIAFESLIYVKSPTALMKLAQTRGVILSSVVEKFQGNIFEYAPNLIKSTAVGHGHADKEGVRKFLDMMLGKIDYKTHDESDAVAIAICHIINRNTKLTTAPVKKRKSTSGGLAGALAHKIG
jgi:crossover junction endodeoxyribonuclease RuvC